jgi:peptidoglycan/LPS O-acetylase OafA/YrhL
MSAVSNDSGLQAMSDDRDPPRTHADGVVLPPNERLKVNNFDGLRLIFASMVVVFHIGLLSNEASLSWLATYVSSTFAVQAFFVVSGFLVFMSCETSSSLKRYFSKRIFRIFPAYFVVVVLSAILLAPLSTFPAAAYFSSPDWWSYLGSNLILSNFSHPSLPGVFSRNVETAVNGSLWTIKVEVMFYCCVPVMVWLIRKFGHLPVLLLAIIGSITWHYGFFVAGQMTDTDLFLRLAKQLPGQLSFFAGGALAYYRTRDGKQPPPAWSAALAVAAYALADGAASHVVAPIAVPIIVYWAAVAVPRLWSTESTGDFSYGLYLYHFPIAQALIASGVFAISPVVGLFVTLALAIAASIVSWFLIEKRALAFGGRLKW